MTIPLSPSVAGRGERQKEYFIMRINLNLRTKSILMIALVFLFALSINTAVLTYVTANKYKAALQAKIAAIGESLQREISAALDLNIPLELIEGLNDKLQKLVSSDQDIAYSMITDTNAKILFHSDASQVGKELKDTVALKAVSSDKMLIQNYGLFYDLSLPLKEKDGKQAGVIRLGIKVSSVNSQVYRLITFAVVVSALCLLFAFIVVYFSVSKYITKPIMQMEMVTEKIASGDLTQYIRTKSSGDEIGKVIDAVNKMAKKLKEILKNVVDSSYQVAIHTDKVSSASRKIAKSAQEEASATEETTSSMWEMAKSIESVAKNAEALATNVDESSSSITEMMASIQQVGKSSEAMASSVEETSASIEEMLTSIEMTAKNSSSMAEAVQETSMTVEEMLSSIEQIDKNASMLKRSVEDTSSTIEEMGATLAEFTKRVGEANELIQRASKEAESGGETVLKSVEGIQRISKTAEETAEIVQGLGSRSEEIGGILEIIEEIADQTNLLALNAAIEAARAGDAGRGFAVVAEEIRKLAERSLESTKEIGEVIKQVRADTAKAVKAVGTVLQEATEGTNLAGRTKEALKKILDSSQENSKIMESLDRSSKEFNKASSHMLGLVENMKVATEEVTGAVREQAKGSDTIRSAIAKMNRLTQDVNIATKEQALGGRQIREALEQMRSIVQQVALAVKEQVTGSRQILLSIENMHRMTLEVANATKEQKIGAETVVRAMEGMSHIASENLGLSEEMAKSAEESFYQVENLQYLISSFKIHTNSDKRCWDIMNCPIEARDKCPAYNAEEDRCWLITGTWCKGVQQGDFRAKLRNCMTCEAFRVIQGWDK